MRSVAHKVHVQLLCPHEVGVLASVLTVAAQRKTTSAAAAAAVATTTTTTTTKVSGNEVEAYGVKVTVVVVTVHVQVEEGEHHSVIWGHVQLHHTAHAAWVSGEVFAVRRLYIT